MCKILTCPLIDFFFIVQARGSLCRVHIDVIVQTVRLYRVR